MDVMRHQPFAIFTDGSNDNGLEKMMPLSINVLRDSGVKSEFWTSACVGAQQLKVGGVVHGVPGGYLEFLFLIFDSHKDLPCVNRSRLDWLMQCNCLL